MKQTAVEWLADEMLERFRWIMDGSDEIEYQTLVEKAKKMEREQHFESYRHGHTFSINDSLEFKGFFDKYYNKTYGKKD